MDYLQQEAIQRHTKLKFIDPAKIPSSLKQALLQCITSIKSIGASKSLDDFDRRKLGIFNLLNFLQLVSGIVVPVAGLYKTQSLPPTAWLYAYLPAIISILVLCLNACRKYNAALLSYFILYPFFTCLVYVHGMNLGLDLYFILYGILSVFFLKDIGYILFTVAFSMVNYFVLAVVLKSYHYQLEVLNKELYLLNQALALTYIFYGLFLIKKENNGYQFKLLSKNKVLRIKNLQIEQQKKELEHNADLLKKQAAELAEINLLKDKLFSVIAHDLKTPMYGLRNLFNNVQKYDLPADELKSMLPDVVNDINHTIGLMENLLQWAKTQMHAGGLKVQLVDLSVTVNEVLQLFRLQASAKSVILENQTEASLYVMANQEMINLVLRNLVSNAIKFTPSGGTVAVGAQQLVSFVEVYVEDNGVGISKEALQKINESNYFTTKGTAFESGTGLGLMLCKEFLQKSGGQMHIESEVGKGSVFSFTLPTVELMEASELEAKTEGV